MTTYLTSRNIALIAAGGFLAAVSLSGTAQAITDTIFQYSSPKTAYFGIPAAAFTPNSLFDDYVNTGKSIQAYSSNVTCFSAPVNLPDGALMSKLVVWYSSLAGWGSFSVGLVRNKLSDGSDEAILSKQPVTTNDVYQQASFTITGASLRTIDNARYVYRMDMCVSGASTIDPKFYSARITYTYTNAGD